jgi:hypothetical protein
MEEEERLAGSLDAQVPRDLCGQAATVPGSNPDTEGILIGQQQWQAIHERRAAGQSISAIARDMELDRKTVRNCALQQAWSPLIIDEIGYLPIDRVGANLFFQLISRGYERSHDPDQQPELRRLG